MKISKKEEKYVLNDPNKRHCPFFNCESYLVKSKSTKFVKCTYGHQFCYDCLKPWHQNSSLEEVKEFYSWKESKN